MSALQVLTALAAAQSLGFRHWDLRLKNIMQHRGDPPAMRWRLLCPQDMICRPVVPGHASSLFRLSAVN